MAPVDLLSSTMRLYMSPKVPGHGGVGTGRLGGAPLPEGRRRVLAAAVPRPLLLRQPPWHLRLRLSSWSASLFACFCIIKINHSSFVLYKFM